MDNAPQISTAPDPISQMQQIAPDAGNNLSAGWGKSIDDYINGLIHRAGDMIGAGVSKMAEGAMSVGNAVGNMASQAAAPFKTDFSPSASQMGMDSPAQGHGLGRERSIEAKPSMEASLGDLSPPSTPSVGVQQGQGHSL